MGIVAGFFVAAQIDAPRVFDCSVTSIPGSASLPVQVVASIPRDIQRIHAIDATARYVGVYRGTVGNEQLMCIIGGGTPMYKDITLRRGDRVSIRNMETDTIILGSLTIEFMAGIFS